MVIFDKDNTPDSWASKVNFVDDNNRCVGYDTSQHCCEEFGWKITKSAEWDDDAETDLSREELAAYSFVDCEPEVECEVEYDEYGDSYELATARFTLTDGTNEACLWLWRLSNGYYIHGFEYDLGVNKDSGIWL